MVKWAAENLCACLSMCSVASWLMGDPLPFAVMVCDAPIFGKSAGAAAQLAQRVRDPKLCLQYPVAL